jgi:hypothetical protein
MYYILILYTHMIYILYALGICRKRGFAADSASQVRACQKCQRKYGGLRGELLANSCFTWQIPIYNVRLFASSTCLQGCHLPCHLACHLSHITRYTLRICTYIMLRVFPFVASAVLFYNCSLSIGTYSRFIAPRTEGSNSEQGTNMSNVLNSVCL